MRRIIDGKVYDTDTATRVASHSSCCGDFSDCDEALYRTKNGRWFLAGEGGPMSRYAEPVPGNRSARQSGKGICPLSEDAASAWCEQNDVDSNTIEEHFSVEEA